MAAGPGGYFGKQDKPDRSDWIRYEACSGQNFRSINCS